MFTCNAPATVFALFCYGFVSLSRAHAGIATMGIRFALAYPWEGLGGACPGNLAYGAFPKMPESSKGTPIATQNASRKSRVGGKNKDVRGDKIYLLFQGKISALNRLNSEINVLMFMSKML